VLASPTTLLGLLQRGRGLGLQLALGDEKEEARGGLAECLRRDPRWDGQVETRELYYAEVATAVAMPAAEIHEILRELAGAGDETRFYGQYQVAGVLGVLAARGSQDALGALVAEVREGKAWHAAAEELADRSPQTTWEPLGHALFARLSDEEVAELAADRYKLDPWSTWEESIDRYKEAVEAAEQSHEHPAERVPPARKADTSLSTRELLQIVERRNWMKIGRVLESRRDPADRGVLLDAVRTGTSDQKGVALWGLRAIGDASLLDDVVDIVRDAEHVMLRRLALRYLAALPPELTLPRARRWLQEPWPVPLAGREVLEQHATIEDEDLLRETLTSAMANDDMYSACFAVDALACFDAKRTQPEIRGFYESTPYSYGRWRAARALARIEDDFPRATAVECLYDCESHGRLLGLEHADRSLPGVQDRIAALAADPAESSEVTAEARRA
jgi:hypothetical protein